jgi:hypothetical protein
MDKRITVIKYCKVCEHDTKHKVEEFEELYECEGYSRDQLIDYWVCQECNCITDKFNRYD